jgi:hypothetical protein
MDLIGVNKMEKIFVAIDNDRIELTGAEKEAFLVQREIDLAALAAKEAEAQTKAQAKAAAQAKLAALGLTVEDLQALGL